MNLREYIHVFPSSLRLPRVLLLVLLRLPRWLAPIEWTTWGGSPECPFGRTFVWPKATPEKRPVYVRCPVCATEWLWTGGQYECGSCGFSTSELIVRRAELLRKRVYLGTFMAWRNADRTAAWIARPWNGYEPEMQQLIIDMVFNPIVEATMVEQTRRNPD